MGVTEGDLSIGLDVILGKCTIIDSLEPISYIQVLRNNTVQ